MIRSDNERVLDGERVAETQRKIRLIDCGEIRVIRMRRERFMNRGTKCVDTMIWGQILDCHRVIISVDLSYQLWKDQVLWFYRENIFFFRFLEFCKIRNFGNSSFSELKK